MVARPGAFLPPGLLAVPEVHDRPGRRFGRECGGVCFQPRTLDAVTARDVAHTLSVLPDEPEPEQFEELCGRDAVPGMKRRGVESAERVLFGDCLGPRHDLEPVTAEPARSGALDERERQAIGVLEPEDALAEPTPLVGVDAVFGEAVAPEPKTPRRDCERGFAGLSGSNAATGVQWVRERRERRSGRSNSVTVVEVGDVWLVVVHRPFGESEPEGVPVERPVVVWVTDDD